MTLLAPTLGVPLTVVADVADAVPEALMMAVATSNAPINALSDAKRFFELPILFPLQYVVVWARLSRPS